jgi:hypothetical protein
VISDWVWDWKLLTWPFMLLALFVIRLSVRSASAVLVALAPYLRYGLAFFAAGSMAMFLISFFSVGKGMDRLAYVPVGLCLLPLWVAGVVAMLIGRRTPPRSRSPAAPLTSIEPSP